GRNHPRGEEPGLGVAPNGFADFVPAHVGHDDVEQDEVRTVLVETRQGFSAIGGGADCVAHGLQKVREQLDVAGGIVDDEDLGGGVHSMGAAGWPRMRRTSFSRLCTPSGFSCNPSNPCAMMSLRSSGITDAVTAMTGMRAVSGWPRSSRSAALPSIPGSWMSIRIRSGWSRRATSIPSSAVVVSMVR